MAEVEAGILFTAAYEGEEADAGIGATTDSIVGLADEVRAAGESAGALSALDEAIGALTASAPAAADAVAGFAGALDQASGAGGGAAGSADAVSASMDQLAASYAANTESMSANTDALAANTAALQANAAGAKKAAVETDAAAGITRRGASMLGLVGAAGLAAGAGLIYMGVGAQNSLSIVAALTGSSPKQMAYYTTMLEGLTQQMGVTMKDAADGLYYVVSAGFQGADALTVLKASMEAGLAGGVSMIDVADGLTTALNAYHAGANQATHFTDIMIKAVSLGKQTFHDFSGEVNIAAAMAAVSHVPFEQLAAAESSLTAQGVPASSAFESLRFLLSKIGIDVPGLADHVRKLGGHFDETKYASLDLAQKILYLHDATGITMSEFMTLIGGTRSAQAALNILNDHGVTFEKTLKAMAGATGATTDAFKIHEATITGSAQHAAAALSLLAYHVATIATPLVKALLDDVARAFSGLANAIAAHGSVAIPILEGLALLFGTFLVGAIAAFAAAAGAAIAGAMAFIAPIMAAGVAIGALVAAVQLFHLNLAPVGRFLGEVGAALRKAFANPEIHEALRELGWQLPQLLPLLKFIGEIVGGALVAALGLLTGILEGVAGALPGIIRMFAGWVTILSAVFRILNDIATGRWGDILHAAQQLVAGVIQVFSGLWEAVKGFFTNFWNGIVGFFKGLADVLVGHSIIPDMVAAIVGVFGALPARALAAVLGLLPKLADFFAGLAAQALTWGEHFVQALATGIGNAAGSVVSAVTNLAGKVASVLHFTQPDEGPLASVGQWMPHFGDVLAGGMQAQAGKVTAAASTLAAAMVPALGGGVPLGAAAAPLAGAGGLGGVGGLGADPTVVALLSQIAGALRGGTGGGGPITQNLSVYGGQGLATQTLLQQLLAQMNVQGNLLWRAPGLLSGLGAVGGSPLH